MQIRRTKFEIANIFLNELKMRRKTGLARTMLKQKSKLSPQGFKEYFNKFIELKLIEERMLEINRDGRKGRFAKTKMKIFLTEIGEEYLKNSNLLLLKIDKLNEKYGLNLDEISYPH